MPLFNDNTSTVTGTEADTCIEMQSATTKENKEKTETGSVVASQYFSENFKKTLSDQRHSVRIKGYLFGFVLGFFLLTLTMIIAAVVLWRIESFRQENVKAYARQLALSAELSIRRQIEVSFSCLTLMSEVILHEKNMVVNETTWFREMGKRLVVQFPELEQFEYAPNDVVTFIYPITEENKLAVGWNKTANPFESKSVYRARETRSLTISGPIQTAENTIAIVGQYPIYYPESSPFGSLNGDGYWGCSVTLFTFDKLFKKIDLFDLLDGYYFQIYEYDNNRIFLESYGNESLKIPHFNDDGSTNATALKDAIEEDILVAGSKWKIMIRPTNGWTVDSVFWGELVVAIFLCIVVFVSTIMSTQQLFQDYYRKKEYQLIQDQLENTVSERTKDLLQSKDELQLLLERISSEEQKTRKILNSIDDTVITILSDGTIIHCNNTFYKTFVFQESNLMNNKLKVDIILPDIMPDIEQSFNELKESTQKNAFIQRSIQQTRAQTKLGREFNVRVKMNFCSLFLNDISQTTNSKNKIVYNMNGTIRTGRDICVLLIHDLTEKVTLQKDLVEKEQMNVNLKTKIEFQEMFDNFESRKEFKDFCIKFHSEENILLLEAIQYYKTLTNIQERVKFQFEIFDKFIDDDASMKINISSEEQEIYKFKISKGLGEIELFDGLEKIIINLLSQDPFKRFKEYKKNEEEMQQYL
ncbi:hypothetical protein ABK040_012160 [Willaertia magna]